VTHGPGGLDRAARIAALGFRYEEQPRERVASCNLCRPRGRPVEVARRDRYGYPATTVVCRTCGLGYLSPRLTRPAYADFYAHTYRPLVSAYHGRRIDAETVQEAQRGYADALARFLEPLVGEVRSVLDVGGSTGVVGEAVGRCLGATVTVLDPSPRELAVARDRGLATIAGFAEDLDPAGRTWDLVLLCQTIDHLLDVAATLEALRAVTAAGGRAFVDVLDVGFALVGQGSIEGVAKVDHPYALTPHTARAFFTRAGFVPVAERLADDGHHGFVLAPDRPGTPDWDGLGRRAEVLLADIWACRARRTGA